MILSNDQIKNKVQECSMIENFVPQIEGAFPGGPMHGLGPNHYTIRLSNKYILWKFIPAEPPLVLPAGIKIDSPQYAQHMAMLEQQVNIITPSVKLPIEHCAMQELKEINIAPGGFVLCVSEEKINMPPDIYGCVSTAPEASFCGISITPNVLASGYKGAVTLRIFNAGPKVVQIKSGTGIAILTFHECTVAGIPL